MTTEIMTAIYCTIIGIHAYGIGFIIGYYQGEIKGRLQGRKDVIDLDKKCSGKVIDYVKETCTSCGCKNHKTE